MVRTVVSVGLPVAETMHIKKNRIVPSDLAGYMKNGRINVQQLNSNCANAQQLSSSDTNVSLLKRFCIVTGVHGDELEGQYICYSLIRKLMENPEHLKGIIDIYPCVNPLGMETITRRVPTFDLDMNRTFPGDEDGDMIEFAASKLVEDITGADFCIDLHASNIFLREIPQARIATKDKDKLFDLSKLLNTEFIWVHDSLTVKDASLYEALNAEGVPTVSIEMGVGMRITRQFGDEILDGIFCVLKELGMWDGDVIVPKTPIISTDVNRVHLLHAEEAGIFLPSVDHWRGISKGELVGEIVNSLTGKVLQKIIAPCDGMVFTLREYPVVYCGSLIARIFGGE